MQKYRFWEIAYKDSKDSKYKIIKNPDWAWAADPFLVEYQGDIYLFAELFLYKTERNAVLGYCKYSNGTFGEWTVTMDKHWHLSYPNVFVLEDKLYMCPETNQMEEIALYELEAFPDKWKKVKVIKMNGNYVDSTFIKVNKDLYMFTYDITDFNNKKLILCKMSSDYTILEEKEISGDDTLARPGGNFIIDGEDIIRVSQDCDGEYGKGLVFCKVDEIWPQYREHVIKRKYAKDFVLDCSRKYIGVHTYNKLNGIEVIDLKYLQYSLKTCNAIRRTHKVFLNKFRK